MSTTKTIFIAFAKEDEGTRNLFTGQRVNASTPFEFTDMSVKDPYARANGKNAFGPEFAEAME